MVYRFYILYYFIYYCYYSSSYYYYCCCWWDVVVFKNYYSFCYTNIASVLFLLNLIPNQPNLPNQISIPLVFLRLYDFDFIEKRKKKKMKQKKLSKFIEFLYITLKNIDCVDRYNQALTNWHRCKSCIYHIHLEKSICRYSILLSLLSSNISLL